MIQPVPIPPTKATLRRYGLSLENWQALADAQHSVCAVCEKVPKSGRLHIDHVHTPAFWKLEPDMRRLFVRCLMCFHCNRNLLNRFMTLEKARRVVRLLEQPLPFGADDDCGVPIEKRNGASG